MSSGAALCHYALSSSVGAGHSGFIYSLGKRTASEIIIPIEVFLGNRFQQSVVHGTAVIYNIIFEDVCFDLAL